MIYNESATTLSPAVQQVIEQGAANMGASEPLRVEEPFEDEDVDGLFYVPVYEYESGEFLFNVNLETEQIQA